MNFNQEIGIIYDTLLIGTAQFNREYLINNNFPFSETFQEVEERVKSFSDILAPIFLVHSRVSAIRSFFDEYINYESDTFDSFMRMLAERKDDLRNKMLCTLFPDAEIDMREPESLLFAIDNSEYDAGLRLRILYILDNLEFAVDLLKQDLIKVYDEVIHTHEHYAKVIDETVQRVFSETNRNLYKQVYSVDISDGPSCLAVSLLNPGISHIIMKEGRQELLFGVHHESELHMILDEINIDVRQVLTAIGNDTRLSILNVLLENGEMTSTMIAKRISQPLTTVLRHIDILFNSGIIKIVRTSGLQIFYKINFGLLKGTAEAVERKISKMEKCDVGK